MALNYAAFEEFVNKMESAEKEFLRWLEGFMLVEAARALKLTRSATPVDTNTLRRNWSISDVSVAGNTVEVYLTNNTEYASHVEYGWRRGSASYAGAHMAKISLEQVSAAMPARFEKQFTQWLNSKLGG